MSDTKETKHIPYVLSFDVAIKTLGWCVLRLYPETKGFEVYQLGVVSLTENKHSRKMDFTKEIADNLDRCIKDILQNLPDVAKLKYLFVEKQPGCCRQTNQVQSAICTALSSYPGLEQELLSSRLKSTIHFGEDLTHSKILSKYKDSHYGNKRHSHMNLMRYLLLEGKIGLTAHIEDELINHPADAFMQAVASLYYKNIISLSKYKSPETSRDLIPVVKYVTVDDLFGVPPKPTITYTPPKRLPVPTHAIPSAGDLRNILSK